MKQERAPNLEIINSFEGLFAEVAPPTVREKFLSFYLTKEDTALLPLKEIAGVTKISMGEILPVPDLPSSILGICNWRGEMLPLLDLAAELGFNSPINQGKIWETTLFIVLEVDKRILGLVVADINDLELHDISAIQSPPAGLFPGQILPLLQGYLPESRTMVLKAAKIIERVSK
ncbi:chemotaxis protein CheW [Oscillatoria salina]|uniref:chemotaxis protein CheW n=1 Tax=Oscillatoria salina TaxID=331517 RepID=UPI001CCCA153|nr:chemotaxis protein CheW [Oscillatoria salina]MBZ8183268.1 chemotaxis protein CheW [Oscillatoria salina IIICB1]